MKGICEMHEFESINQTQTQITDWLQVRYLPGPETPQFQQKILT
jgi:hypothetical protein